MADCLCKKIVDGLEVTIESPSGEAHITHDLVRGGSAAAVFFQVGNSPLQNQLPQLFLFALLGLHIFIIGSILVAANVPHGARLGVLRLLQSSCALAVGVLSPGGAKHASGRALWRCSARAVWQL